MLKTAYNALPSVNSDKELLEKLINVSWLFHAANRKYRRIPNKNTGGILNFISNNEIIYINYIKSLEFNIDTACVEDEYARNMYEVSALDYLIHNEPMSYVRLLLSGKMKEYLRNSTVYTVIWYEINFCRQHHYGVVGFFNKILT